jgi:hypothetical protein
VADDDVRSLRIALAVVALVLALGAALVAVDVERWRDRIVTGDRVVAANPAADVSWTPSTLVPFDPARRLVGPADDIDLREAVRAFVIAQRTPYGFDNGQQRTFRRERADAALAEVILTGSPRQVAQADVLTGVLAFSAASAPAGVATPGERSVEALSEAARLDPADLAAKFDLELVLRALAPQGTRPGSIPSAGGKGAGHKGAGAGLPGRGF